MEPASPRPAPARLDGIDLLRGVACLLVIFYHVGMYWHGALWKGWGAVLAGAGAAWPLGFLAREGLHGVSLFLVLSGFCLHHPLAARDQTPRPGQFLRQRALRILPPYYLSLALLVGAVYQGGWLAWAMFPPLEAWDVAVHALLLHNLHARTIWSLNGAYWSLALEWQLYLIFPALFWLARRAPAALLALAAALAVVAPPALERWLFTKPTEVGWWGVAWEGVPAHLFEFCCGMVAAELLASGRVPGRAWLAASSMLWLPAVWAVDEAKLLPTVVQRLACGVSFAALALLVGPMSLRRTPLGRALLFPGVVSYSLYLLHQPLLLLARPWLPALALDAAGTWLAAALVFLPLALLLSWLFYRAVEAPFLRGGAARRWLDGGASAGGSATPG